MHNNTTLLEFLILILLSGYGILVLLMVFGPIKQSEKALKVLAGLLVVLVLIDIIAFIKTVHYGH